MTESHGSGEPINRAVTLSAWFHVVLAMTVVVVLPVVVLEVLIGKFAADAMFIGIVLGVLGNRVGGTHGMLYIAPALGLAAGLGAFTAYGWWWAVLLAFLGVIVGGAMRYGWLPSLLMLPFAATFAAPVSSGRNVWVFGVIAGIATAYGVLSHDASVHEEMSRVNGCRSRNPSWWRPCWHNDGCRRLDRGGARVELAVLGAQTHSDSFPLHPRG